ncbi:MAG TPA: DUF362 domain-containing protein [Levilinea sp.]|nr:DUF362 domain-containing protein [Levilinea sp.]
MNQLSRRNFIIKAALGASALGLSGYLSACSPKRAPEPAPQQPAAVKPSMSTPDLVVARGKDPEELVRQTLAALGGMQRFVAKDSLVIVKPNICHSYHSYEYAATTNPWVVGALVKLAFEAGARKVQVMDYPFAGSAEEAYIVSGIQEQVLAAGGEMVIMPRIAFSEREVINGLDLESIILYDGILEAGTIINVPIAKTHSLARLTLGMKNLLGVVQNRSAYHSNMGQRLVDLVNMVKPSLTVVDAVRMLMANGPTGGNLDDVKQADTLVASTDIVAADAYGATLFGMQPEDLNYVVEGTRSGLGRSDLANLKIEEIAVGG